MLFYVSYSNISKNFKIAFSQMNVWRNPKNSFIFDTESIRPKFSEFIY
jgi:hypothetical protein